MTKSVSRGAIVPRTENTAAGEGTGSGTPARRREVKWADFVISVVLLVVFAAAFGTALQWQAIAGLFPLIATGVGIALSAAFAVSSLLVRGRAQQTDEGPLDAAPAEGLVAQEAQARPAVDTRDSAAEEDADTEDSADSEEGMADQADADHMFFASLSRQDWVVSLAYLAAFFVGLSIFGLYVASAVFTVGYLRFQAKSSWLFSVGYAVVMAAAVYALFGMGLQLPVPEGLFGLDLRS